jgi:hypothetical protein
MVIISEIFVCPEIIDVKVLISHSLGTKRAKNIRAPFTLQIREKAHRNLYLI